MDPRVMVAALGTEAVTVPAGRISMMEAAGGWATTRDRTSLLRGHDDDVFSLGGGG
jgi:hypothetical protein